MSDDLSIACVIEGCQRPSTARGLCAAHYRGYIINRRKQPVQDRAAWERRQMELGLLRPVGATHWRHNRVLGGEEEYPPRDHH